jgi:hypothetical protein
MMPKALPPGKTLIVFLLQSCTHRKRVRGDKPPGDPDFVGVAVEKQPSMA